MLLNLLEKKKSNKDQNLKAVWVCPFENETEQPTPSDSIFNMFE